ncbi:MAG: TldD/PmbA family protein [Deltaproteobacteria bacterium]|nr:TldD/PmbA family protein [Deltaproteobacteria bacterium]
MDFQKLKNILSRVGAEYGDLRYEIKKEVQLVFSGRELTQISSTTTDGYVLRVLKNGGFSNVVFTKEQDGEKAIRKAEENALLMARYLDPPVSLAPAEVIRDTYQPILEEDPRSISMEEKLALTRSYNLRALEKEKIVTTQIQYLEVVREKFFINTEGTQIREDLVTTRLGGTITSQDGGLTQTVRVGTGGSSGFALLRNQEALLDDKTALALDLLKANPVNGGTYSVILNPDLAGVFAHEAFGHYSEADLVEDSPSMLEKLRIGNLIGHPNLSIIDDPTLPSQLGFYKYDDEGVPARAVPLISQGVLSCRLHSRRTSSRFQEPLTGHCVAEDYRYAPIIRMGTIYIKPGAATLDDLLAQMGNGLYLADALGGQTSGENFTFGAEYGRVVKNGRLGEMVRDINLSGNLYHTLRHIEGFGNDLVLSRLGGCGKGQINIRSCHGGPHCLVRGLIVGGR